MTYQRHLDRTLILSDSVDDPISLTAIQPIDIEDSTLITIADKGGERASILLTEERAIALARHILEGIDKTK